MLILPLGHTQRGALLSVERDPGSRVDLEELFQLLDTEGEGGLPLNVVEELIADLDLEKPVDAKEIYETAAQTITKPETITFEQFISAWGEKTGYDVTENDKGLKAKFDLLN